MNPTDFAKCLTNFFTIYLSDQKNVSKNTIYSYRDTFKLLLTYCQEVRGITIERIISINTLTAELIIGFLNWLEEERNCGISTRNQRLAAIHSFFRYAQGEDPAGIYHFQQVISIPVKTTERKLIEHLSPTAMELVLAQPDSHSLKGRRDLTLLSVLYDTGARVQELVDLKVCDVSLDSPAVIKLTGKGSKYRRVPLMKNSVTLLKTYLSDNNLNERWKNQFPLFINNQHRKLTRKGVDYIINKYVKIASTISLIVPQRVSPHIFRHSKAMHLLQAGIDLIYIRDFLGHVDINTTEIYAVSDTEVKRNAIERACPDFIKGELPDWNKDKGLLSWLSGLK